MRKSVEILSVAVGLAVLLEVSARVYFFGFAGLSPVLINSTHGLPQTGFTQRAAERRIGFELRSNLDSYFKLVPFRTNSRGLRDREYPVEKPENTFRVAVVGSSFALPAGVAIEDAFHSVLERQLSDEFAPIRCEFINFAVGMHSPEQTLAMLELRALEYEPDLILFTATRLSMPPLIRDPSAEPTRRPKPGSPPSFRRSYPVLQSFLARLLLQRTAHDPANASSYVGVVERLFMAIAERGSESAAADDAYRALARRGAPERPASSVVQRLGEIAARTGIPIALIRLEFDPTARLRVDLAVEEHSRAAGLHYLDTRDAFRGTRPSDFWIYRMDPHPDDDAHATFARVIARFLRSRGLLPQ